MELNPKLINNSKVDYVIRKAGALGQDVISAYGLFCESNPEFNEAVNERLERVYVMCRYLDAEAEDIISMLLFHDYLVSKVTQRDFQLTFNEKRSVRYFDYMNDARRDAPTDPDHSRDEGVSYYIMLRVCDKTMQKLLRDLSKKGVSSTGLISNAYSLAKKAQMWSYCEQGVPSVISSIAVAGILAEFGSESPVIAAALLHDSVAGGKCGLDEIDKICGSAIVSQYVDAVLSIESSYSASQYRDSENELDVKRIEKLIRSILAERRMMLALHIKAAETVNEIRSLDPEASSEIRDRDRFNYLTLLETFRLEYFCSKINELNFRARDYGRYMAIRRAYDDLVSKNRDCINELKKLLTVTEDKAVFAELFKGRYAVELRESLLSPDAVFECIMDAGCLEKSSGKSSELSSWINKKNIPICYFDIIVDPLNDELKIENFMSVFVKLFEKRAAVMGITITDIYKDGHDRPIYQVEDHYHNVFKCRISTRKQDFKLRHGFEMGAESRTAEDADSSKKDKITVQLRNGKPLCMPKGSTVIDLAYAIHEDLGNTVKGARINGKKANVYTTLYDGDHVVIESDASKDSGKESNVPLVRVSWLKHVVTKKAKNKIIDQLIIRDYNIEGDDPAMKHTDANDERVSKVADIILSYIELPKQIS